MKEGLKTVLTALTGVAVGGVIGAGAVSKISGEVTTKMKNMSDKHLALFRMMNQWVKLKQQGKNLSSYFEEKGYTKIAIYGMSYAGETLLDELSGTPTQVVYGIDQRADKLYAEVDIVRMEDTLKEVDAIIVTAITFFDEIENELNKKIDCPIISLEDVLYEV